MARRRRGAQKETAKAEPDDLDLPRELDRTAEDICRESPLAKLPPPVGENTHNTTRAPICDRCGRRMPWSQNMGTTRAAYFFRCTHCKKDPTEINDAYVFKVPRT